MSESPYTLGHDDAAAERLAHVSAISDGATRSFLDRFGSSRPELAVDLGCGPGYTTRLIAEVLHPRRLVGLDISDNFVAIAQRMGPGEADYVAHDATSTPFPTGPADLVFARFLLSHLGDPAVVVASWASQLRPAGLLLLHEVEDVTSADGTFRRYLELVDSLLRSEGGLLRVGPLLHEMPIPDGTEKEDDRTTSFDVPSTLAARSFHANLRNVRDRAFVRERMTAAEIDEMGTELTELADARRTVPIRWSMREIAYRRA